VSNFLLFNIVNVHYHVHKIYAPFAEVLVFSDPVFSNDEQYFLSTEEAFMRNMEKSVRYVEKSRELNLPDHPLKRPFFKRYNILVNHVIFRCFEC